MSTAKWLVFAIIIAALLPAGRDILSEIARELTSALPAPRADSDKAKTRPRRAELEKHMETLRGDAR
jgi:hypothetical protein